MIDIAVIGSGPAGLSAAINAKAMGKNVEVFSSSETYLTKAELVNNYLGFYNITGKELMDKFIKHAMDMDIPIKKGKVLNIAPISNNFMLNFNGEIVQAKTVILAIGIIKGKPIKGEQELLGKGVSYCAVCDGMLYKNKQAVVLGLEENSEEEANLLKDIGVNVIYISNKQKSNLLNEDIKFIKGSVNEIIGENSVEGIKINGSELIKTDAVFISKQNFAPTALISTIETEDGFIKVDKNMNCNIKGMFASGDCTGAPLQIAKAVGEGLIAAGQAVHYINETKEI